MAVIRLDTLLAKPFTVFSGSLPSAVSANSTCASDSAEPKSHVPEVIFVRRKPNAADTASALASACGASACSAIAVMSTPLPEPVVSPKPPSSFWNVSSFATSASLSEEPPPDTLALALSSARSA